jgi:hypothetical protein
MRRPSLILILLTGLLLVLAACGGSPSESPDASSDDQPGASEPAASEPAASEPAASQGGSGGGGGGIGVDLSNGSWTGGQADVEVSGSASATISAPLFAATSITDGGSTTLTYVSADGGLIGIAIYADSFAVSVTTADLVGGGGTTTTCDVAWNSTADNNIAGGFSCPDSPAFTVTGGSAGTVDIEGSFTATR